MLKHMLTQTSSLPATPAAAKTFSAGPNFKLPSRNNQSSSLMLEEANLEVCTYIVKLFQA